MNVNTIGIVGAGLMGAGIAQVCAQAELDVVLYDISDTSVKNGIARIAANVERMLSKQKISSAQANALVARVRATVLVADLATVIS